MLISVLQTLQKMWLSLNLDGMSNLNLLSYCIRLVFFLYVCQQFYKFFLGVLGEVPDLIGEEEEGIAVAAHSCMQVCI